MARILLITDSPTQTLCMQRVLHALQHEVSARTDLQQASQTCLPENVDLVLVELQTSTGNGFEAGLTLRNAGYRKILLLTSVYHDTDEIWAQALGIDGVTTWPLPLERLQQKIAQVLTCA